MRAKGRQLGRFVSLGGLKKLAPPPSSSYPLLIVDATGLPVFFLCEWYRRQKEENPGRTADTYLDMALPWAGFLLQRGYAWNDRPDRIRAFLIEFLRTDVKCLIGPDAQREDGLLVETTGAWRRRSIGTLRRWAFQKNRNTLFRSQAGNQSLILSERWHPVLCEQTDDPLAHVGLPASLPPWLTEVDLAYYSQEFSRTGFTGGLNWYRNTDRNWELLAAYINARITQPTLFLCGGRDPVFELVGPDR